LNKINFEKWGIGLLITLIVVISVQYFLQILIAGQAYYFKHNITGTLFFGVLDLFPLFLGTTMMAHIIFEIKNKNWSTTHFASKFAKSFFVFLILMFEIYLVLFYWRWNGDPKAALPGISTLSISILFVWVVYKRGGSFQQWTFRLMLLFGVFLLILFAILNFIRDNKLYF